MEFNSIISRIKVLKNPVKLLKYLILNISQKYFNSNAKFADQLIESWLNRLISWLSGIFVNGFVIYLVFSGILFIVPKSESILFLGTSYWHIPIVIFYLGLSYWFFRNFWIFLKGGKPK